MTPDSFAGITVPEGEPESMRDAAASFRGAGSGLQGVAADLRGVPGAVGDWQGPASAAFNSTAVTNGSAVDAAVEIMSTMETAASDYATALDGAQERARTAIADARDAQRRIDEANADIAAAESEARAASIAVDAANAEISANSVSLVPVDSAAAYTRLSDANDRLTAAGTARADAERRLAEAEEDLRDAQRRGEEAEEDARTAARSAAGAFNGVAGGSVAAAVYGGSPSAMGEQIVAQVRAGDFTALDGVPLNYLPPEIQERLGGVLATAAQDAAIDDPDRLAEISSAVDEHSGDQQLADGFYNTLGGDGARTLITSLGFFNVTPNDEGYHSSQADDVFSPFSSLLATATDGNGLRDDFTDDFFGNEDTIEDRLGTHELLAAFLMSTGAGAYGSRFVSRAGKEVLIDPRDPNLNEQFSSHIHLDERQDFMSWMSDNPEAAALLMTGESSESGVSNMSSLLQDTMYMTDDGEALGELIHAGAHEARDTNIVLANQAAHEVIQTVPHAPMEDDRLPDGLADPLTTIAADHIVDMEVAATNHAMPGVEAEMPADGIHSLTYEESRDYLTTLIDHDSMRGDTTSIIADRVAENMNTAVQDGDSSMANRAGVTAELGVIATHEADLSDAERSDTMNELGSKATDKLIGLTPVSKVPGLSDLTSAAMGDVFNTDHVKDLLESQGSDQLASSEQLKSLAFALQIENGQLPEEAAGMINSDGTIDFTLDGTVNDREPIMVDGEPLSFDLDGDGEIGDDERELTTRDLYDASLGPAEAATDGQNNLLRMHYMESQPPKIDDLPVPDGFEQNNPNAVENVLDWPFDSDGENAIEYDGEEVATKDDLEWDPHERIYRLDVEGVDGVDQLQYVFEDGKWHLAERDGNEWVRAD